MKRSSLRRPRQLQRHFAPHARSRVAAYAPSGCCPRCFLLLMLLMLLQRLVYWYDDSFGLQSHRPQPSKTVLTRCSPEKVQHPGSRFGGVLGHLCPCDLQKRGAFGSQPQSGRVCARVCCTSIPLDCNAVCFCFTTSVAPLLARGTNIST